MRNGKWFVVAAACCALAMTLALLAGCTTKAEEPSISSISPSSGAAGTEVTISGSGFGSDQGTSTVEFGTVTANVSAWSDGQVKTKVPSELEEGEYKVKVSTDSGTSQGMEFQVKEAEAKDDSTSRKKQGQVEHDTPVDAIEAYAKAKGMDVSDWTFSVYSLSKSDSNWKIDQGSKSGQVQDMFLLHYADNKWTVVADAKSFTQADLAKYGAPSDLVAPEPQPQPQPPNTQTQIILNYLQSKGRQTNNWSFDLLKVSSEDPNWEVIEGTQHPSMQKTQFMLVWNNASDSWEVISDAGPPWTGVEFKGQSVPDDLEKI
jgi:hypothetical protein